MLQQVADAVRSVVRSSDHAARQGGDEFAVLLSGCSPDQALVLAEALREQIGSCPVEQGDKRWYVTASIGVSHFQSGEESIKAALDRADAASYRAKRGGRDRVILDSEEPAMTDLDESTGKVG